MPFRERRIASHDALSLYVRDYGDPLDARPALLCLGGLTRNSSDFDSFAEWRSGDARRVICPDYRGRGRSDYDRNWRNYDPRAYLRDIQDLLAALNVHKVVVVGTSLGGILAMAMGAAQPGALAGAVLNDIGPEVEAEGMGHILRYIRRDRPQRDWEEAVATIKRTMPNLAFQNEASWLRMAQNTFRRSEDGKLRFDWDVNVAKPMLRPSYKIPDMWPLFRTLRNVPVLLLRGERSDILSPSCVERMRKAKPDLTAREIPGTGHAPTLGEPEARAALDEFLADR